MEQVVIIICLLSAVFVACVVREIQYNRLFARYKETDKQLSYTSEVKEKYRAKWLAALDKIELLEAEIRSLKNAKSEVAKND